MCLPKRHAGAEIETEPILRLGNPRALYDSIDRTRGETNDFIVQVNQLVNRSLQYTVRMSPGVYTPEELLEKGIGSCRDFAWLLVQLYRHCGLAARFVSGYSIQLTPDLKPLEADAPASVSKDVCDLHAWCEVYLPGAGWVGVDATSGLWGRDYQDVCPIQGVFVGGGKHGMTVGVDVRPER